jgi:hypothetical protein
MSYLVLKQTNDVAVIQFDEILAIKSSALISREVIVSIKSDPYIDYYKGGVRIRDVNWNNRSELIKWVDNFDREPMKLSAEFE